MNPILAISLLCGVVMSATFTWDSVKRGSKKSSTGEFTSTTTADGTIHMFWERSTGEFQGIDHQVITPEGDFAKRPTIDFSDDFAYVDAISAQAFDNGKDLILVLDAGFYGLDNNIPTNDGKLKVFYIESSDRGITWTDPELVAGTSMDGIIRHSPSIHIEQSTGRIYVLYNYKTSKENEYCFAVAVREPGKKTFEPEILLPKIPRADWSHIGQTVDKKNSKEYLHAVGRTKTGDVIYSRSSDRGKTWDNFRTLGSGRTKEAKLQVAINTRAVEAGIFIQYDDTYESILLWSNDHGDSFIRRVKVGYSDGKTDLLNICGYNGKGLLFSAHHDRPVEDSFIKVSIIPDNPGNLMNLPYPFLKEDKGYMRQLGIHCRYVAQGHYSLTYISSDPNFDLVFVAFGTFKGI